MWQYGQHETTWTINMNIYDVLWVILAIPKRILVIPTRTRVWLCRVFWIARIRSDMQKSLVQRVPSIFFVICVDFVYSVALPIYLLELPKSVQLPT